MTTRIPLSIRLAGLLLIMLCALSSASAQNNQVKLTLTMSAKPSPYLSDWSSKKETVILTVTNTSGQTLTGRIDAKVMRDGALAAETKLAQMPVVTIPPGVSTFFADEVLPENAVKIYGNAQQTAIKTGMLPAGSYQVCVNLLDAATSKKMAASDACRNLTLTSYQAPQLTLPANESQVKGNIPPTFHWVPVIPTPTGKVRYRVMVFEVLKGQTPMQAFKSNKPIVARDATLNNQMMWPADVPFPGHITRYVWSVRAYDANDQPVGEPDGYASPFSFTIGSTNGHGGDSTIKGGKGGDRSNEVDTSGRSNGSTTPSFPSIGINYQNFTDPYENVPKKDLPFTGTVRNAITNEPIVGATVEFRYAKQNLYGFNVLPSKKTAKTDANGEFHFPAIKAPTFFSLTVSAESYISVHEYGPGQKMESAITNYVVLMKPRQLRIVGSVVDKHTKKKVPNAVVELWRRPDPWCDACPMDQNIGDPSMEGGGLIGSGFDGRQVTNSMVKSVKTHDAGEGDTSLFNHYREYSGGGLIMAKPEGSFVFEDIPYWNNYYLKIKHPRYETWEVAHIPVEMKDTINLGSIEIKGKRGTVKVTVLDKKTNMPISGATVNLFPDVGSPDPGIPGGSAPAHQINGQWNPGLNTSGRQADYIAIANAGINNRPYVPRSGPGGFTIDTSVMSSGSIGDSYTIGGWTESASGWGAPPQMGSNQPTTMPDMPALYTATTDMNGKATIANVLINDPDQSTDRYAIWVRTPMYGDAWKPARLTKQGETVSVTILQDSARGFIEGIVTDKNSTLPIGNCKVELFHMKNDKEVVAKASYTNPDGTYTIYPVPVGTYTKMVFTKEAYGEQIKTGPIKIEAGTALTISTELVGHTGSILVKVFEMNGTDTNYLANAFVHSTDVPNITGMTAITGTTLISNVPVDSVTLVVSLPTYVDKTVKVLVKKDQTAKVNVTLAKPKASLNVLVIDSVTNAPIKNASITIKGKTLQTDLGGMAAFEALPVGTVDISVIPDTTGPKDYKFFASKIVLTEGLNQPVTVRLKPGARITGKVVAITGNVPLDSVKINAEGVQGAEVQTGADGTFVLRNLPAGVNLKIVASKPKYVNGKAMVSSLQVGQVKTGVNFALADSPIDSVYGFAISLDTITDAPGGGKYLKGKFKVPNNLFFALDGAANFSFLFENLEVDATTFKPISPNYYFPYDQAPIKLFDAVEATMGAGDDFLKVTYDTTNKTGVIRAKEVKLKGFIPDIVPGAKWLPEKLSALGENTNSIGFWADGAFHGGSFLRLDNTQAEVSFWGFKLKVDYTKTTMADDGFHYVGSLTIPKINKTIAITDLFFKVHGKGEEAHLEFEHVKLANQPPLEVNLFAFKFIDSALAWTQQGLVASGSVVLTKLANRTFRFENMMISKEGKFMGVNIKADNNNAPIEVLGSKFYITGLGFTTVAEAKDGNGQVVTPETHLFTFSGNLQIPQFNKKIEFQNLTFSDQGDFKGTIAFNQSVKFFNTINLELQEIKFDKEKVQGGEKKFIFVKGGIAFNIPLLAVQVGNLRFYEDKTFAVEKIGFAFNAGPVNVSLAAEWNDSSFAGTGLLAVQPVLSVAGEFYYKDGNNWKIKIAANIPPIPIGPVAITGVSGMLARNNGYWAFGFGGSVATAAGKESMELTIQVAVETSPQGPIIQGDAWLKTLGLDIGEAHVTIDIPKKRFSGSVQFGFKKNLINITGFINFEVKAGEYWFVGGGAKFDFLKVMTVNTDVYVGKNYPGFAHTFPVLYHPDNATLNGVHFDASTVYPKIGKSGDWFHMEFGYYIFGEFNWDGNLAAGMRMAGSASLDVWLVGFNIAVEAQAAIQYKNNALEFHANADLTGKAWIYPCDAESACDSWCMFCPCVHLFAHYSSNSGWDADFSISCDD